MTGHEDWTPLDLPSGQRYASGESGIMIVHRPDDPDPGHQWEVFIPPTRIEHFDGYEAGDTATTEELHENATIEAPWGTTYWPTFQEAAAFLQGCIERGEVVPRACPHPTERLQLMEDGYSRCWGTTIDAENKTITAAFTGSEDFSEDGDGEYLHCHQCGASLPVPDGYEINWV